MAPSAFSARSLHRPWPHILAVATTALRNEEDLTPRLLRFWNKEDLTPALLVLGCVVGALPWVAIGAQIGGSVAHGHAPPTFAYAIFASLFVLFNSFAVLFNSFAVNQALQYRRVARWREYRYGERWYLWLSLVAKSLLAWQVFANALAL